MAQHEVSEACCFAASVRRIRESAMSNPDFNDEAERNGILARLAAVETQIDA